MTDREKTCKACDGSGKLADDEGWQYRCSVCDGKGEYYPSDKERGARIMSVDDTNRLLD